MKVFLSIVLVLMTLMTFSSCSADAPSAEPPFFFIVDVADVEEETMRYGYLSFGLDNYIPPIYDSTGRFSVNGLALVWMDDACYVIDTKGDKVCDLPYTHCYSMSVQHDCYRVIEQGKKGVVNAKGKDVIPVEYDGLYYNGEDIVAAVKGNTTTVFNLTGKQLAEIPYRVTGFLCDSSLEIVKDIPDEYDEDRDDDCSETVEVVGVADINGTIVVDPHYYEWNELSEQSGYYKVCEKVSVEGYADKKYGIINAKGEVVIPIEYDEILYNGVDTVAAVTNNDDWLFDDSDNDDDAVTTIFNLSGQKLAEMPYSANEFIGDSLLKISKTWIAEYDFVEGYGVADISGKIVVPLNPYYDYDWQDYERVGDYLVYEARVDGSSIYHYYYFDGTSATKLEYEGRRCSIAGSWFWTSEGRCVYHKGKVIAEYSSNYYFYEIENVYGKNGDVIDDLLILSSPYNLTINDGTTHRDADRGALMDSSGRFLVEPGLYDEIFCDSKNGYLMVYKDGKYGLINLQGDVVVECAYDDERNDVFAPYWLGYADNYCVITSNLFERYHMPYLVDENGKKVPGMEGETLFSFEYQNETYYFLQREFGSVMEVFNENLEVVASYQPTDPIRVFLPKTWG